MLVWLFSLAFLELCKNLHATQLKNFQFISKILLVVKSLSTNAIIIPNFEEKKTEGGFFIPSKSLIEVIVFNKKFLSTNMIQ